MIREMPGLDLVALLRGGESKVPPGYRALTELAAEAGISVRTARARADKLVAQGLLAKMKAAAHAADGRLYMADYYGPVETCNNGSRDGGEDKEPSTGARSAGRARATRGRGR